MRLDELIGPDRIVLGLRVQHKTQLLQELAKRAAAAFSLDERRIFEALRNRETLGSTGLGKGFALPHARLEALTAPVALLVRLARPIDFAAIDERPIDLGVLLLTPADAATDHLATLATVSRAMRDDSVAERLRRAPDAAAAHAVLAEA